MTTTRKIDGALEMMIKKMAHGQYPGLHLIPDTAEGSLGPEYPEEWSDHDTRTLMPWDRSHVQVTRAKNSSESTQTIEHVESRLDNLERNVQATVDIGLENRKLLEQIHDEGNRAGLGAIHSLDQGRVQLSHPLVYSYQVLDDEVVVGVEEFGIYGVGATEYDAVGEVQEELWSLIQDLERTPPEKLGTHLTKTLRTLRARI